jgi:transcriptional antiterminator RfaH
MAMTQTLKPEWSVLYTRARAEKKMGEYCRKHAFEYFLPLRKESKIYQRRKVEVWKPLFPGYIFVKHNSPARIKILESKVIVKIIPVPDQQKFVKEIENLKIALTINPELVACPAIVEGASVRVKEGPFMGIEGIVEKIKSQTRVIVAVSSIGQGVPVEIDSVNLEFL